jgi:putative FmdB family regulatory protein
MPTYQYKCDECGVAFERFQHFSEEPVRTCPECDGPVHRVIHPVGVIFKGSGFYVTDNKKSGALTSRAEPKEAKAESAPEPKTSTKE